VIIGGRYRHSPCRRFILRVNMALNAECYSSEMTDRRFAAATTAESTQKCRRNSWPLRIYRCECVNRPAERINSRLTRSCDATFRSNPGIVRALPNGKSTARERAETGVAVIGCVRGTPLLPRVTITDIPRRELAQERYVKTDLHVRLLFQLPAESASARKTRAGNVTISDAWFLSTVNTCVLQQ